MDLFVYKCMYFSYVYLCLVIRKRSNRFRDWYYNEEYFDDHEMKILICLNCASFFSFFFFLSFFFCLFVHYHLCVYYYHYLSCISLSLSFFCSDFLNDEKKQQSAWAFKNKIKWIYIFSMKRHVFEYKKCLTS